MWFGLRVPIHREKKRKNSGQRKSQMQNQMPEINQGFWFRLSFQSDLYHPIAAQHIKWQVRLHKNRFLLTLIEDYNNWYGGWSADIASRVWAIFSLSDNESTMRGSKREQSKPATAATGAFVLVEWQSGKSGASTLCKYIIHISHWKCSCLSLPLNDQHHYSI